MKNGTVYSYRPILKWAGGKRQILDSIMMHVPDNFGTYYEPFAGGAALLASLYSAGRITKAVISDTNSDLYNLYTVIKNEPSVLIDYLKEIRFGNNAEDYYEARDLFNTCIDSVKKAGLLIYLNRHCYNGLYRVNSSGKFNVPFGRYRNPGMPSEEEIRRFSEMAGSSEILNLDFESAVRDAVKNDFVYFDPPYIPLSRTSKFTGYTSPGFGMEDQERLGMVFSKLSNRGVFVMESNSSSDLVRHLYGGFNIFTVSAKRVINSVSDRRSDIEELIITNF